MIGKWKKPGMTIFRAIFQTTNPRGANDFLMISNKKKILEGGQNFLVSGEERLVHSQSQL